MPRTRCTCRLEAFALDRMDQRKAQKSGCLQEKGGGSLWSPLVGRPFDHVKEVDPKHPNPDPKPRNRKAINGKVNWTESQ